MLDLQMYCDGKKICIFQRNMILYKFVLSLYFLWEEQFKS